MRTSIGLSPNIDPFVARTAALASSGVLKVMNAKPLHEYPIATSGMHATFSTLPKSLNLSINSSAVAECGRRPTKIFLSSSSLSSARRDLPLPSTPNSDKKSL